MKQFKAAKIRDPILKFVLQDGCPLGTMPIGQAAMIVAEGGIMAVVARLEDAVVVIWDAAAAIVVAVVTAAAATAVTAVVVVVGFTTGSEDDVDAVADILMCRTTDVSNMSGSVSTVPCNPVFYARSVVTKCEMKSENGRYESLYETVSK